MQSETVAAISKASIVAAQVSGWFVMTTADARRVAEPWLRFSEDVRLDPEVTLLDISHADADNGRKANRPTGDPATDWWPATSC